MENIEPIILNNIIVEKKMINDWPEIFNGYWINIYPKDQSSWDYSAELLNNSDYNEGEIIYSDKAYFPNCVAIITWQKNGHGKFIWVKEKYRGNKIGYYFGLWLRTYLAKNNIRCTHEYIHERNDIVEEYFTKFKNEYQADDIKLRNENNNG